MVSGVYYWRAQDRGEAPLRGSRPIVDYAEWMERNGPIPRLIGRLNSGWARRPAEPVAAE